MVIEGTISSPSLHPRERYATPAAFPICSYWSQDGRTARRHPGAPGYRRVYTAGGQATREFDTYFASALQKRARRHGFRFIKPIGDAALLWGETPRDLVGLTCPDDTLPTSLAQRWHSCCQKAGGTAASYARWHSLAAGDRRTYGQPTDYREHGVC